MTQLGALDTASPDQLLALARRRELALELAGAGSDQAACLPQPVVILAIYFRVVTRRIPRSLRAPATIPATATQRRAPPQAALLPITGSRCARGDLGCRRREVPLLPAAPLAAAGSGTSVLARTPPNCPREALLQDQAAPNRDALSNSYCDCCARPAEPRHTSEWERHAARRMCLLAVPHMPALARCCAAGRLPRHLDKCDGAAAESPGQEHAHPAARF